MFENLLEIIPEQFLNLLVVTVFSLLIGLEQRRLQIHGHESADKFGSDRTFTFIGIFGFITYILDPERLMLFAIGGIMIAIILAVYYTYKIKTFQSFGITTIIVSFITYCLAPVVVTQPKWLTVSIVVAVLILVELKPYFQNLSKRFSENEFITLAKFLLLAGVILPILPDKPLFDVINLSPYTIWLAVVVVAGISYFSYLLQKYVFKKSGVIVTGLLGGIYSSTATTIILARNSHSARTEITDYAAAIVMSSGMTYLRVALLLAVFNHSLAFKLLPLFGIMLAVSFIAGLVIKYLNRTKEVTIDLDEDENPLELKMAFIFAALLVIFSLITHFTQEFYGDRGMHILSFLTGFTHIDPFLINVFDPASGFSDQAVARFTFQAIIANLILKAGYTFFLAGKKTKIYGMTGLGVLVLINVLLLVFIGSKY